MRLTFNRDDITIFRKNVHAREAGGTLKNPPFSDPFVLQVQEATCSEDVFGKTNSKPEITEKYWAIARVIHPDKYANSPHAALANSLFAKLVALKNEAEEKASGKKPLPIVIESLKHTYTIGDLFTQGDKSDLYACSFMGPNRKALLKIAQSPADNDLLENEAKILGEIFPEAQIEEKFLRHLPRLIDSFKARSLTAPGASTRPLETFRQVNVLELFGGSYSLADVIRAYPAGLDFRDVVWMWKRLLSVLGFIHREKRVIHGAILPTHVLVHPTEHNAKVIDWCYAIKMEKDARIKALSTPYRDFYAPEIIMHCPAGPATDIYMSAKCVLALLGGNVSSNEMPKTVPERFQGFVKSCLLKSPTRRPDDAWTLQKELDDLLLTLVGKPKYRALQMPLPDGLRTSHRLDGSYRGVS
jgi:serine/threonine protein kinase